MPAKFKLLRSLEKLSQPTTRATIVRGKVPEWISGSLYRNGPGKYEFGDKEYAHLFDGHACVHKFTIDNGEVHYSNRMLATETFQKTLAEKRLYPMFGTSDLCSNVFGRLKSFFFSQDTMKIDNTNVNIMPFGSEHLYALTESNMICKLDPQTLDILERVDVTKALPSATTTIAHPHLDDLYEPGSWITMGMNMSSGWPHHEFIVHKLVENETGTDKLQEHSRVLASIPSSHKHKRKPLSYAHSFGLTEHYVVFLEQSLIVDFEKYFVNLVKNKPFDACMVMEPATITRIHLIERKSGRVLKCRLHTDPLFCFHHINAYETPDGKAMHVDLITYDPATYNLSTLTYRDFGSDSMPKLNPRNQRITIDMSNVNDDASNETSSIHCPIYNIGKPGLKLELPTINYMRKNTRAYKYFYATNYENAPFSVVKVNVEDANDAHEMSFVSDEDAKSGVAYLPSEPVFIERPGATEEDDGVVLTMVLSDHNDFLSILDAKDLSEIARAQLDDGVKAAMTFHGFFHNSSAQN